MPTDTQPLRVLLVEDNFLVSMLLEDALRVDGHQVVGVATSAEEALQMAAAAVVDIALIDVDLDDGRTGVELAATLRRDHGVPALYATGQGDVARQDRGEALGVLDKPYTAEDVVLALRATIAVLAGREPGVLPRNLLLFEPRRDRVDRWDGQAGAGLR